MTIWLALAVGAALGCLRAVAGMIANPSEDVRPPSKLLATVSAFGAVYGAIIWAVWQAWALAYA